MARSSNARANARSTGGYAAANKPVNSVLPAITGTKTQGQTLTCSTGTWTNSPSYSYQWNRGTAHIAGANSSTYVLTAEDVGYTMTCTVTATKNQTQGVATSAATTVVS